jgi:hypothetical protein
MSWVEIFLASASNFKWLGTLFIVIFSAGFFVVAVTSGYQGDDDFQIVRSKIIWPGILIGFLGGAILSVPSIDDLWHVRIGLIKLQLASPENIQKGSDVIERLGHKLECKYLGCETKKGEKSE